MKPEKRPDAISVYLLMRLDNPTGKLMMESVDVTEQGDMGLGCYSSLEKAQHQQVIVALKGIRTEVFTIEYPLNFKD